MNEEIQRRADLSAYHLRDAIESSTGQGTLCPTHLVREAVALLEMLANCSEQAPPAPQNLVLSNVELQTAIDNIRSKMHMGAIDNQSNAMWAHYLALLKIQRTRAAAVAHPR